ncbi:hypothetical protein SeMB42_g06985 [Synchytrium endobioticum]|uniref:Uncharacterized protein n=1 Tax=Synchytrium endobioticum TaxID=286115 RepID=A0A507CCJ1_9FUNG|nr:hypothetical protein SeMB42_g06985 [Synchytrium endobioticum]
MDERQSKLALARKQLRKFQLKSLHTHQHYVTLAPSLNFLLPPCASPALVHSLPATSVPTPSPLTGAVQSTTRHAPPNANANANSNANTPKVAYYRQVERKSIKKTKAYNAAPGSHVSNNDPSQPHSNTSDALQQPPSAASHIINQARSRVLTNIETLQLESANSNTTELYLRLQLHFRDAEVAILRAIISGTSAVSSTGQASSGVGASSSRDQRLLVPAATNPVINPNANNTSTTIINPLEEQLHEKNLEPMEAPQDMLAQLDDARQALRVASNEIAMSREQSTPTIPSLVVVAEKEVQAVTKKEMDANLLETQIAKLQKQFTDMQQTHLQDLETIKFQYEHDLADITRQHQDLLKKHEFLTAELTSMAAEPHGDAWARWHTERTTLISQLDVSQMVTTTLQERIRTMLSDNSKLEGMVTELSRENEALQTIQAGSKLKVPKVIMDLETELSKAQQTIASLTSANETVRSRLAEVESQRTLWTDSVTEKAAIQYLQRQVAELTQQLQATRLENASLKARFEPIRNLRTELCVAKAHVAAYQEDISAYDQVLAQIRKIETTLRKEFDVLQMDYWKLSNERMWMSRAILNIDRPDYDGSSEGGTNEEGDNEVPQVDVIGWIKTAILRIQETSRQLADAHKMLDVQHSRIEALIVSQSSSSSDSHHAGSTSVGTKMKDSGIQTDAMNGFMAMSTIRAHLLSASSSSPLKQHNTRNEQMLKRYTELQSKYETSQSELSAALQQLGIIKRLLIYSSASSAVLSVSSKPHPPSPETGIANSVLFRKTSQDDRVDPQVLVARFVDATISANEWRAMAEKYRRRCEEVEEIIGTLLVGDLSNRDQGELPETQTHDNSDNGHSCDGVSGDLSPGRGNKGRIIQDHRKGLFVPCRRCQDRVLLVL